MCTFIIIHSAKENGKTFKSSIRASPTWYTSGLRTWGTSEQDGSYQLLYSCQKNWYTHELCECAHLSRTRQKLSFPAVVPMRNGTHMRCVCAVLKNNTEAIIFCIRAQTNRCTQQLRVCGAPEQDESCQVAPWNRCIERSADRAGIRVLNSGRKHRSLLQCRKRA